MAENLFSNLNKMIEQVGKEKGIDKDIVVDAVIQGMLIAARKEYGTYREIEAMYNDDAGEVELVEFKEVVTAEEFIDELVEIKIEEAQELDPEAQLGDSIGIPLDTAVLGRIAAQTARQIIIQKVRDAERDNIHKEFLERQGEIASGIARRVERGAIVVDLGKTEAHLPYREQIPGEQYKPGDRIQGYILEVRQTPKGPQIIMSRSSSEYLSKLFEMEVPEVYEGVVEIIAAAREPGQRAKIAVSTTDPSVDPVGACVGMKGSRVQNIVQELRGEKIDIVTWDEDITRFACNALAPAEIAKVFVDADNKEMEVVVPDNQLSLAIGKRGQNVRLAAKLTGWKLDIISSSQASSKAAEAVFNLKLIEGISDTLATGLFQYGYTSFYAVAEAMADELTQVPGFDEETANKVIEKAEALIVEYDGKEVPTLGESAIEIEAAVKAASNMGSSKASADQRLKDELASLIAKEEGSPASEESTEEKLEASDDVAVDEVLADQASETTDEQKEVTD